GDNLTDEQIEAAHKAAKLLLSTDLSPTQAEKRDQYISRIGIEVDDCNAADLVGLVAVKA
ncbi:hypothetical protein DBR45_18570, partial [Pseudomonas sp. HMWF031]